MYGDATVQTAATAPVPVQMWRGKLRPCNSFAAAYEGASTRMRACRRCWREELSGRVLHYPVTLVRAWLARVCVRGAYGRGGCACVLGPLQMRVRACVRACEHVCSACACMRASRGGGAVW